ncbi:hypothetical protein B0H17DRAFT_1146594 [Mycena rosella]|uniref:Uncharacterized protein n=1 Tax=Mycena rosella TaxID=1033263 RepID=A0AAD7G4C2_MYCRO|nr:hypothetical protein B0H17DRAFT_1146594 [Mycena rosella]
MSLLRALITAVIVSTLLAADANAVNITTQDVTARQSTTWSQASWIWPNSYSQTSKDAPIGVVVLRRTFQPLIVLPLVNLKIAITADNAYYLYVNGKLAGSGLDWTSPGGWTVNNVTGNVPIAVAIVAVNYGEPTNMQTGERGPAGVLATFTFTGNNGFDTYEYVTDGSWRGAWFIPDGSASSATPNFIDPSYIDSGTPWAGATVIGAYGIGPWGTLPEPTASSLQS